MGATGAHRAASLLAVILLAAQPGCDHRAVPASPNDPQACFSGAAFIECPGEENPRLFCEVTECKWVSNGYPVGEFLGRVDGDCRCSGVCPDEFMIFAFTVERGLTPWTRRRALDLKVSIEPSLTVTSHTATCHNCPQGVCGVLDPCNGPPKVYDRSLPGTYRLLLGGSVAALGGWSLELEVDLDITGGPKARACRLLITDVIDCHKDVKTSCATAGTVRLSARPDKAALDVAVAYDLTFADGLRIVGEVAGK